MPKARHAHNKKTTAKEINSPPKTRRDQCGYQEVSQSRTPTTITPGRIATTPRFTNQSCRERLPGGGQIRCIDSLVKAIALKLEFETGPAESSPFSLLQQPSGRICPRSEGGDLGVGTREGPLTRDNRQRTLIDGPPSFFR